MTAPKKRNKVGHAIDGMSSGTVVVNGTFFCSTTGSGSFDFNSSGAATLSVEEGTRLNFFTVVGVRALGARSVKCLPRGLRLGMDKASLKRERLFELGNMKEQAGVGY